MKLSLVPRLDEVLSPEADTLLGTVVRRGWLNNMAIGVWRDEEGFARTLGPDVDVDSRFELGSLTKLYTAELLGAMAESGQVALNDPVAKFLKGYEGERNGTAQVTLADLATHCSGLPRLPPGMTRFVPNPYAKYTVEELERDLAASDLARPLQARFMYSNYGYSVLGYALSKAAGMDYSALLEREMLTKAGLQQTSLAMEGTQPPHLLDGHTRLGRRTEHWTFDACAPCGGLCSTVGDQLRFLAWILDDPERVSLRSREPAGRGRIGLGWMLRGDGNSAWHNGATFGFSCYMALDRRHRHGVVVLSNRSNPALVSELGVRFEAALRGEPMAPLQAAYLSHQAWITEPLKGAARAILRQLGRPPFSLRFPS